jgi:DNA-binding NarL/FixJ family response regulator
MVGVCGMNILVVDDHVLIREALRSVLKGLKRRATILEARDRCQALELLELNPSVELIVLDLTLPDCDGFSLLAELRHTANTAIVVLSASHDRTSVERALDLGAIGFIPKTTPRDVMLNAFRLIFAGGVYIPQQILGPQVSARGWTATLPNHYGSLADLGLTKRQREVLSLMMKGKSNKAIGRALNMAEPTVKNYVTVILKTLKVANRTEAVIKVGQLEPTGGNIATQRQGPRD